METVKDRVDGGSGLLIRINVATKQEEAVMFLEDMADEIRARDVILTTDGLAAIGYPFQGYVIDGNSVVSYRVGMNINSSSPKFIYKLVWSLDYWRGKYGRQIKMWEEEYKKSTLYVAGLFTELDLMLGFVDTLIEAYRKSNGIIT